MYLHKKEYRFFHRTFWILLPGLFIKILHEWDSVEEESWHESVGE